MRKVIRMPTQYIDNNPNEIRAKIAYNGEVLITYIDQKITLDQLCQEIKEICRFAPDQVFTMKWVDEEGDPCTISSQMELDEAIRLYEVNRDSELTVHGKFFSMFFDLFVWNGLESEILISFRKFCLLIQNAINVLNFLLNCCFNLTEFHIHILNTLVFSLDTCS